MFPSNWELSSARASTVVRFFGAAEVNFLRMKAVGLADTRPKVPNYDLEGKAIPENQQTNRRISVRVYPMNIDEREKYNVKIDLKSILKDIKKDTESSQSSSQTKTPVQGPEGDQK